VTQLELVRVADEALLRRFHGAQRVIFAWDFTALPADPIEDYRPALKGPMGGEQLEFWLGTADGADVVTATIRYPMHDNLDLANIEASVHPEHRGQGHGRAGVEAVLQRVRELGRTRVMAQLPSHTRHVTPAPAIALAQSYGAKPLLTEYRRVLDAEGLDLTVLEAIAEDAQAAAAGYTLVMWGDRTPPEWVEDMAGLLALMSTDPPQGELDMEPEVWDAERYLSREQSVIDRGRQHLVVAARDDRSGRLAGFTDLAAPIGTPEVCYQWSTIVAGEHRGHRLGMLMKVANLRQLRTELPFVRYLNTWNAEENSHMVAINEALGFVPMESWTEWGLASI
jgi:GNAT superfamily N-acetyltransferase